MLVSCMHPVAVVMTCSLFMLVEDARGNHMEEAYSMFVILLFNVMELLCVVGGALLDRPCMVFHRMCVLCLWSHPSDRLDAPSIWFVCVFVCRKLSPHLGV